MNVGPSAFFLFLGLFLTASLPTKATELVEEVVGKLDTAIFPATPDQLANISLCLYTGNTTDEYESVRVENATELMGSINTSKPIIFYIFGWTEGPGSTSVRTVVGAFQIRGDYTIVLVNWESIAGLPYPAAAASVIGTGKTVASALDKMIAAGLNALMIYIIGHSLGAHVAGAIGRYSNSTMPRITGLDPAGPEFYGTISGLISSDASFVDMIHTDAGGYGTATNKGTVNFFPNGGFRYQPQCPLVSVLLSDEDFCSHHRSWYYYAETLLNETAMSGVPCDSYGRYLLRSCSNAPVVMGYGTPPTASGAYYLQTNGASPYGRGVAGETPELL